MHAKHFVFWSLWIGLFSGCASIEKSNTQSVLDWDSQEGISRLERSTYKVDFFPLVNVFESQTNKMYCGPTSGAIVLNALRLRNPKAPKPLNPQVTDQKILRYMPKGENPNFERYSQSNFLNSKTAQIKTQDEILGKPAKGAKEGNMGLSLRQFSDMLRAHGLVVQTRHVDDKFSRDQMRKELMENLSHPNDFVIVNYSRQVLGQKGGGHISPVAAFDAGSDSFLVLDVNSNKAKWVWIPSDLLFDSMHTADGPEFRGYVLVRDQT